MKKVFAIVLIVCLAMTAVFADKGDFKVGAQVGLGTDSTTAKVTVGVATTTKTSNSGFYFAAAAEYEFADNIALKASAGLNLFGKAKSTTSGSGASISGTADDNTPANFSLYVGGQYAIEVNKKLDLVLGAGMDLMSGKLSKDDDAKSNTRIGLGIEAVIRYAVQDNFAIDFGTRFGIYFANTNSDVKDMIDACDSYSNLGVKIYAGATFTL